MIGELEAPYTFQPRVLKPEQFCPFFPIAQICHFPPYHQILTLIVNNVQIHLNPMHPATKMHLRP
jgi:hypothetical protein